MKVVKTTTNNPEGPLLCHQWRVRQHDPGASLVDYHKPWHQLEKGGCNHPWFKRSVSPPPLHSPHILSHIPDQEYLADPNPIEGSLKENLHRTQGNSWHLLIPQHRTLQYTWIKPPLFILWATFNDADLIWPIHMLHFLPPLSHYLITQDAYSFAKSSWLPSALSSPWTTNSVLLLPYLWFHSFPSNFFNFLSHVHLCFCLIFTTWTTINYLLLTLISIELLCFFTIETPVSLLYFSSPFVPA